MPAVRDLGKDRYWRCGLYATLGIQQPVLYPSVHCQGLLHQRKLLCGLDTCNLTVAWFPPPSGLMELRIRRRELLAVPIDFMFPYGHSQSWNDWVDKELQDDEFVSCLRRANIYSAVLLSRGSDMYRDIQGLRQLVRRWNPATHTFFLAWGEVTITLEDIERILLLPCLGDNDLTAINLTVEETRWEDAFYLGFGGRIKLAQGMSYPLGALCLGNLYIHLDRLHDDEVEGSSYHAVESSINVTLLQVFVMEHLRTFVGHVKTSKAVQDRVLRSLGDGKGFLSKRGFRYPNIFPIAPFRDGYSSCFFKDGNLKFCTFLAAITPTWLPTFRENGMETIHYNPHRVRRQFGLDQDMPIANVVVFDCDTVMAPFIIIRASKYWSDLSVRVTIPADICQEAESTLLAMPLKQGKALSMREPVVTSEISSKKNQTSYKKRKTAALATSLTNDTNGEGSNKKACENDDTNLRSRISRKTMASDSADLRKSKPVVLAICAIPVGLDVIASSPIVIDEGPSDSMSEALLSPSTSEGRVNIPEVIEKDDSSNTSDIPGHDDISIQEVPLTMAPSATANILESVAHFQENDLNTLPQIDTVVTDNTHSSEVDLAIQRCGETPHGVSSPLVVGVAALGNTHPCYLNFGSAHSLAMNIVEQDAPVSIVEKNDFDLIQGDFDSFLSRLNETRANLRIASHFWSFLEAKENFLHFSVLAEAVPLLEKLLLKHGNFMSGFKLGMGFGDFSLALLVAVLMNIHHTPFDLLDEGKLFEWMDAVRDLMTTSVAVGFLLDHIRNLGEMWFAQKEKKKQLTSLSSKIAKMEEELLALKSESEYLCAAIPVTPAVDMPLSNGLF
uniref:Aminotransferase-like plant mobile domain-containing protein n=1 Tax=Fagus sylvatica TaxID=28930 RepID=A0A2N9GJL1_FAGSY